MKHYPYVIVGGGLAGTLAAIALAQQTEKPILFVDEKNIQQMPPQPKALDVRTLALNENSIMYLTQLGLWSYLEKYANPIRQIQISEQGAFGRCELSAQEVHHTELGAVIEIQHLVAGLSAALEKYPHIHYLSQSKVTSTIRENTDWHLTIGGNIVHADYLLIADGTYSTLRQSIGISVVEHDYQQSAIVAVCEPALPHHNIAYERFAQDKILAVLPLTQQRIGTVLTAPQDQVAALTSLSDKAYLAILQNIFGWRLGKLKAIGARAHYPLKSVIAEKLTVDNAFLLGNAAHTLNPIGAQGLNLGIAGIQACLSVLAGKNPIDSFRNATPVENFTHNQLTRAQNMLNWTHQTQGFFSSSAWPTRQARRIGLLALEHSPLAKKRFIRRMMGIA